MAEFDAPDKFRPILPLLRLARDNDARDPVVAYWCRFYAAQKALGIDSKSPECKTFIIRMMDQLETDKKSRKDNEAISDETVAQAYVENFGMRLFDSADNADRSGTATINTAKLYLSSSNIFDVLAVFGEQSPEIQQRQKYAKYRAMIIMKAVKQGEPIPPPDNQTEFNRAPVGGEPSSSTDPPAAGFVGTPTSDQPPSTTQQWPGSDLGGSSTYQDPSSTWPGHGHETGGAFQPTQPQYPTTYTPNNTLVSTHSNAAAVSAAINDLPAAIDGSQLSPAKVMKAQKYCKFAGSALQYNDVNTAVDNLQKALLLLTTGQDSG